MQRSPNTSPRFGQNWYVCAQPINYIHEVAAMGSCFILVRTNQHGIARRMGAGIAQWREHSLPTNVAGVRFSDPASYVG